MQINFLTFFGIKECMIGNQNYETSLIQQNLEPNLALILVIIHGNP